VGQRIAAQQRSGLIRLESHTDRDPSRRLTLRLRGQYSRYLSMPSSPLEAYFPLLVQALLGVVLALGLVGASFALGKRVRDKVKDMPYESGMTPIGSAKERFSIKFYLVAMLFILFDIEAVFLYPWVVVYRELKMVAFVEMFIFVVLILSGFFYIWKKGVLDWSKPAVRPGQR
jgi:NADH-quinone oxidoreductase subunit A